VSSRRVDSNNIKAYIAFIDIITEVEMASLTIRNIEDTLKASLRIRAAEHGRSMEEEARQILRRSLVRERAAVGLGSRIASRFAAAGGVDLPVVSRSPPRPAPGFGTEER
jgi:plasmid stability protein